MRVSATREQIMDAMDLIKDDPNFALTRQRVAEGKMPIEMFQAMSLRPEILRLMSAVSQGVYPGGLLERSVQEAVILESSRRNACQFCTASHTRSMQMMGIADDPIAFIDNPDAQSERERLALAYTRAAMEDSNRVPDSLFAELKQAFTEPEIVELTFLIGFINLLNLFNNCLQVTFYTE
jgi:AhpD family alkylhydroperoxidase